MSTAEATKFLSRRRATGISEAARRLLLVALLLLVAGFAGPAGAAEKAHKDATDTLKLAPIQVPIIVNRRVVGQAGVLVQLQLTNPGDFDMIDHKRPQLLDAFLSELYGLFDQFKNAKPIINPTIVKQHLLAIANRVLGPGKIREVVILRTYEKRERS